MGRVSTGVSPAPRSPAAAASPGTPGPGDGGHSQSLFLLLHGNKSNQELGEKLILSITEMEIHCPVPSGQHRLAFFASIFPSSAFHFCDVLLIICSLKIIFLVPVFCYTNSHIKGNVRVNCVVQCWKKKSLAISPSP